MIAPAHSESKEISTVQHERNNFDFLRLMLALAVIFSHSYLVPFVRWPEPLAALTHGDMDFGDLAVDCFFVISGFLITASWQRSNRYTDFLANRVLRIFPGFIAASLICAYVVGPIGADNAAAYFHHLNSAEVFTEAGTLGVPDLGQTLEHVPLRGLADYSMWTIRPEFACYLLTFVLGLFGVFRLRAIGLGLLIAGLLTVALVALAPDRFPGLAGSLTSSSRFAGFYFTGTIFYLYREKIPLKVSLLIACLILLIGLNAMHLLIGFAFVPITYCLMFIAFLPVPGLSRVARYFDASYGIYLYGWPVQQLVVKSSPTSFTPIEVFAIAGPIACACAIASWFLVEKPCLQLKPRKRPSKDTHANHPEV